MSTWIKSTDKRPPVGRPVLCFWRNQPKFEQWPDAMGVGQFEGSLWVDPFVAEGTDEDLREPDYWTELPQPPAVERAPQ